MIKLKEIRKSRGITLQKIAEYLNTGTSTISQYETGKREASFETLTKLADYFNVSIDYLLGRETTQEYKPKGVKIPVLGTIPAGIPIEAIEEVLDYEEISEEMARKGEYFALKVNGDSMLPTIKNGDIVIIRQQEDADSGKICVVMINGYDATLKEIKKEEKGIWILPHNSSSEFKPSFYSNEEVEQLPIKIIGIAVEIRRSL